MLDLGISGRRALIAGSSSGIGAAVATALAQQGVEVIVHGRSADSANAIAKQIKEAGGRASVILASLSDPASVRQLAADALAIGPIDILINSAGAASTLWNWFDAPDDAWQKQFQISTFYAVQLIQQLVPAMRERGWGRVLNVSSGAALSNMTTHPEYASAKLALHSMTATLANEVGKNGVTVNTLVPGAFGTPNTMHVIESQGKEAGFTETGLALEKKVIRDVWGVNIPVGRMGRLEEIAQTACFLVSEPAAYITGAALRIDGGATGSVA